MRFARLPACHLAGLCAIVLVLGVGCSRQYFHESQAGERFYQTASGDIIRVNRSGYVMKGSESEPLGVAKKAGERSDWDLQGYQVVSPSGHCLSALSDDVRPTPCYALIWEVPLVILASPFRAIQDAFQEGNLSTAGVRSSELPAAQEQQ